MAFREYLPNMCRSAEETLFPEEAPIKKKLPPWLKGSLVFVGPAKFDFNGFSLNNWVDGCCMVSKCTILPEEQKIKMEKKYLRTDYYKTLVKNCKPNVMTFGTRAFRDDENKNFISRLISNYIILEQPDNCGGILHISGKTFMTSAENCYCHPLDLSNLTVSSLEERVDMTKSKGLIHLLNHGQHDAQGNLYNIGLTVTAYGCYTNVVKIPHPSSSSSSKSSSKSLKSLKSDQTEQTANNIRIKNFMKKAEIIASWPTRHATTITFTHSFGMSQNYIVHIDQPYYTSLLATLSSTVKGQCFKDILKWHSEEKNKFIIVDKRTNAIHPITITSKDPFYFNHFINVYEEDDHLIIDILAAADPSLFDVWNLAKLRNKIFEDSSPMKAVRFVIPLVINCWSSTPIIVDPSNTGNSSGSGHQNGPKNLVTLNYTSAAAYKDGSNSIVLVSESLTSQQGMEGPTTNPNFAGRTYSYFYASQSFHTSFFGRVGKFNVRTKECLAIWKGDDHHCLGQPVFIPNPGSKKSTDDDHEDDGIVAVGITSGKDEAASFILFLDAKTFSEITRVEVTTQIPLHLHSYFWGPDLVDCC